MTEVHDYAIEQLEILEAELLEQLRASEELESVVSLLRKVADMLRRDKAAGNKLRSTPRETEWD